ncbi:MAG: ABC transporter permease [Rubrobacteraceae bacterium]
MLGFLVRRVVLMFVALFIIATATWFLMQFLPGSPFNDAKLSDEARAQLEAKYGLDDPLLVQYGRYMANLAQGDLGNSFYFSNQPVLGIILERLPVSAFLGIQAVILGSVVGIALGMVAAMRHNTFWDSTTVAISVLGISVPSFVLGPLLQYWVGVKLGWLPIAFFESWRYSILPTLALAAFVVATVARFIRSEMLEVFGQDYVTLAKAKGLSQFAVVLRHVLRNAAIPLITVLAPLAIFLITGTIVVERIFEVPGIGEMFIRSIVVTDYSMIMGTTLFFAVAFVLAILVQDILYAIVDPRIRVSGESR